jgi:hypothetical protein
MMSACQVDVYQERSSWTCLFLRVLVEDYQYSHKWFLLLSRSHPWMGNTRSHPENTSDTCSIIKQWHISGSNVSDFRRSETDEDEHCIRLLSVLDHFKVGPERVENSGTGSSTLPSLVLFLHVATPAHLYVSQRTPPNRKQGALKTEPRTAMNTYWQIQILSPQLVEIPRYRPCAVVFYYSQFSGRNQRCSRHK